MLRRNNFISLTLASAGLLFGTSGCFDSTASPNYYPGLSDNSVPPSVATYPVGGDVSGTLDAITIKDVGGVPASSIAQELATVTNATDANTPSTLVFRNSSGSFSAGTITATQFVGPVNGAATSATVANYSTGQLGGTLNITAPLTLLLGGDTFPVASVSGQLNGSMMPSAMSAGSRITFIFSGSQVVLQGDSKLKLKSGGVYRTVSNGTDTFTFVLTSASPLLWVEVSRSVAASFSAAELDAGIASVNTGSTTNLIFDTIDTDLLGEYNNTNGDFIAHQGGLYRVKAEITTSPTDWSTQDYCRLDLVVNSVPKSSDIHYPTAAGAGVAASPCHLSVQSVFELSYNDVVNAQLSFNRATPGLGVTIPAGQGLLNRFEITRIQ